MVLNRDKPTRFYTSVVIKSVAYYVHTLSFLVFISFYSWIKRADTLYIINEGGRQVNPIIRLSVWGSFYDRAWLAVTSYL
jgi:hypothetical protein